MKFENINFPPHLWYYISAIKVPQILKSKAWDFVGKKWQEEGERFLSLFQNLGFEKYFLTAFKK